VRPWLILQGEACWLATSPDTAAKNPARELAAIMFSDVVGYTSIMGRDEQHALRALDAHRELLRSLLPKFNGRMAGEIGDGTLTSFHSAIDAVNCAREVQASLQDQPELKVRIGIHLGDVVFSNNTVLGDGVNVASRIHALAPPGGICVSSNVYDEIRNKPGARVKDLGEQRLKNVSRPIRVYVLQAATAADRDLTVRPKFSKRVATGALVLAATVAIVVAYVYRAQIQKAVWTRAPAAEGGKVTVAVLPFANLSANKQDEYFSDGMTDEIAGELSKIPGMQVAARGSSFAFKGKNEDVSKIASLLHVRNLLEGSVQRSSAKLRIEVQLIDAGNGFTLWSERYDEEMADVFKIQSEVAESVAQKLRVKLLPAVKERLDKRPTENLEAYNLYLQGRYYYSQPSSDRWTKAIDAFSRAIEKDPNFALAYTGLANAYSFSANFTMPPRDAIPKIRAAVARALALDDSLSEAHGALANDVLFSYDWNWTAAEREFRRALELDPSNSSVHSLYGDFLSAMGRYNEALQQKQRAYELNPLWIQTLFEIGWVYRDMRKYERALEYCDRAIEREPNFPFPYVDRGMILELQGHRQEAVPDFERAAALSHSRPDMVAWLGAAYAGAGRRSEALKVLDNLKEQSYHRYVDPVAFVTIYAGLGDYDQAFQWMDEAYRERDGILVTLKSALWDPLRSDPRFQAIYKKVGLPE
jgi:adenylate cyclase